MVSQRSFRLSLVGLSLVLLAGCASHTWAPGPDARGTFDEARGRCSLMARHSGHGFYAAGSERFVASAALGAAIGNAIRTQNDFNDCMSANGWVMTDSHAQNALGTADPRFSAATPVAASARMTPAQAAEAQQPAPSVPACTQKDKELAQIARKDGYQYHSSCE